jgi:hypothetical protein
MAIGHISSRFGSLFQENLATNVNGVVTIFGNFSAKKIVDSF